MAVELKNRAEGLLLAPLATKAVSNVFDVLGENIAFSLVGQRLVSVLCDLNLVLSDILSV